MRRREFIVGIAGLASPFMAPAQSASRHYRVAVLDTSPRDRNPNFRAFRDALSQYGYIEGDNLTFEYRSAAGRNESFADFASELTRLDVDAIVTRGTPAALAAKAATTTIPVVMAAAGDPVAIARGAENPAANLTGFGASAPGAERRRVQILKDMLPQLVRVAALTNLSNPSRASEWKATEAAARYIDVDPIVLDMQMYSDIERAFDVALNRHADALVVGSDTLIQSNQNLVVSLAAKHRLPAIYSFRDFVEAGGLVSYGVSLPDLYQRAATYVAKILMGAKPFDLPIEQAAKFELVVSVGAAKTIGLAVPNGFLARADEIIE
jgi:putative tryptophan/tyrosine transport system substrate-binding protein